MQLVGVSVIIVAALTFLVGMTVFLGSKSNDRFLSATFLVAAVSAAMWAGSIITFLDLRGGSYDYAPLVVAAIYITAITMTIGMVGYVAEFADYKFGRWLVVLIAVAGLTLSAMLIVMPQYFYEAIELDGASGNVVHLRFGWFYIMYMVYFACAFVCYVILLLPKIFDKETSIAARNICVLLLVGLGVTGLASLGFDLLLPLTRYDLIWVGPLAVGIVIVVFYYAILRYRMIVLNVWWASMMSYAVLMAVMALVYIVVLYAASTVFFGMAELSVQNLVLSFVMIVIVLLVMPVLSELMANVKSLLSVNSIDVDYIAKRLRRIGLDEKGMEKLMGFLADHMHFSYVGVLLGDKLCGSKEVEFTQKEVEIGAIENKYALEEVWQESKLEGEKLPSDYEDMRAVVDLRDASGQSFGKIILGTPYCGEQLSEDYVTRIEMVVGLVAGVVDPGKQRRKV